MRIGAHNAPSRPGRSSQTDRHVGSAYYITIVEVLALRAAWLRNTDRDGRVAERRFQLPNGAAPTSLECRGMGVRDWGRVLGDENRRQFI